ncbi:MAG: Rieske 2Fe-2S domain-containing protein [Mycobacterium sp.]|nr:Rieske 2Fe-2S domain-containing protein [Mycobacterium sp.]MBV9350573.1 Rieske 2Fe-2S domain-containing protein [Mycobacterium sp.]
MSDITLGPVADLPLCEGRAYAVEGRQIAVFRLRDGSLRALEAVCPHRGGPLADGLMDDRVVVCPLHGHTYELDSGCEVANGGPSVATYPVHTNGDGTIRLSLPERNGASPPNPATQ